LLVGGVLVTKDSHSVLYILTAPSGCSAKNSRGAWLCLGERCFPKTTLSETNQSRYGTRRHAAAMAGLWRTQFPGGEAAAVWEACADSGVLEEMGYVQ